MILSWFVMIFKMSYCHSLFGNSQMSEWQAGVRRYCCYKECDWQLWWWLVILMTVAINAMSVWPVFLWHVGPWFVLPEYHHIGI